MRANKVFKKVLLFIVIVLSLIIYVEYMNGNLPWLKEIMIEMGYDQPTNDGTTSGGEGYSLVPVESPSSISSGNINVEDIPEFTNQPIVISSLMKPAGDSSPADSELIPLNEGEQGMSPAPLVLLRGEDQCFSRCFYYSA